MTNPKTIVDFNKVSFRYDEPIILENVNLNINQGDFVAVVGPNGGGKTTIIKLILGLLQPLQGDIKVFDKNPAAARNLIGYVPQRMDFDRDFPMATIDLVLMGRLGHTRKWGPYRANDKKIAQEALAEVELQGLAKQPLGTLSGGQFQRALIARALASQPRLMLLDEPTASVDKRVEQGIYDLLKKLNQRVTIVLVSHDIGFVSSYVNRVACVNRHVVTHPTSDITGEMGTLIEQIYGGHVHVIRHDHKCPKECDH